MDCVPPEGLALLLCDDVYTQERGGKQSLIGLFNRVVTRELPAKHPRMVVFASVTDIRPNTIFKLDIVDAETDRQLFMAKGPPPKETGPLTILDLVFTIDNLTFPEPGTYYVRLLADERVILQRPIDVVLAASNKKED